jgi:hypothetical protein
MATVYHHDVRITKVLGPTLFIGGVLWFLLWWFFVSDWQHFGFEIRMFVFAPGFVCGPVGMVVGGFLLLKQYESRRSGREREREPSNCTDPQLTMLPTDLMILLVCFIVGTLVSRTKWFSAYGTLGYISGFILGFVGMIVVIESIFRFSLRGTKRHQ